MALRGKDLEILSVSKQKEYDTKGPELEITYGNQYFKPSINQIN